MQLKFSYFNYSNFSETRNAHRLKQVKINKIKGLLWFQDCTKIKNSALVYKKKNSMYNPKHLD